jgi:hypothetical protein
MKKVSTKSDRKMEFLTFITECKSFRPITYGVNFLAFFQRISNSASNFALNDIHIEFLQQKFSLLESAVFANSKAKRGQSDFKKTKNLFYKCVLSHYTPISDLRASI